ncbi:hypothetical protein [Streptomyces beigongshangae]|uniref:hypothetical protein n=1 Tax=Streptomyces beigongshangae TaxID=2841597 RepID=UPI001C853574|nr:hypothetical protein [Streptomyces sp. REN17]
MELRSVEELMDLLYACRGVRGAACPGGAPVDLHDHALQTAALLRRSRPADKELQVAGLVQAVGQLLGPSGPVGRARLAAGAVGPLLGERVARLVRLRVPAPDRGTVPDDGRADDHSDDHADDHVMEDVLLLRQADESARTAGLDAGVLEDWRTVLELVSSRHTRLGAVD